MIATQAHTGLTQQRYKHRVTSFSSHIHAPPVKDTLRLKETRERVEEEERTRTEQQKHSSTHRILPASHFNCRQINSDFSLDGPMWKRKKA